MTGKCRKIEDCRLYIVVISIVHLLVIIKEVMQSLNRLGVAQRVPGGLGSQIS